MGRITVKDKVLTILNEHKGKVYSGQELADTIGVSRNAVWKAVNTLREDGFTIEASTNGGYTLAASTDIIDQQAIQKRLTSGAASFFKIACEKEVDSTNDSVKKLAELGEEQGYCLIAESQRAGRGRKGRSFYSPESTGLYISLLLRPNLSFEESTQITSMASVAAAKAFESMEGSLLQGNNVAIKWINDIYINNKKICGILTEAGISLENGGLDYAVLGLGVNITDPVTGWPKEIENIAGSLYGKQAPVGIRNDIAAAFLNKFYEMYSDLPNLNYIDEYRTRQLIKDCNINVYAGDGSYKEAYAKGVDDNCRLIVRFNGDSEYTVINSGEVTIRLTR